MVQEFYLNNVKYFYLMFFVIHIEMQHIELCKKWVEYI